MSYCSTPPLLPRILLLRWFWPGLNTTRLLREDLPEFFLTMLCVTSLSTPVSSFRKIRMQKDLPQTLHGSPSADTNQRFPHNTFHSPADAEASSTAESLDMHKCGRPITRDASPESTVHRTCLSQYCGSSAKREAGYAIRGSRMCYHSRRSEHHTQEACSKMVGTSKCVMMQLLKGASMFFHHGISISMPCYYPFTTAT